MAFADPQSITINGSANSLPRVSSSDNKGGFSKDDQTVALSVQHTYAKRTRRMIRVDHQKTAADPVVPANNRPYSMSAYLVVDVPRYGYTPAEAKQVVDGFIANLNATSGANLVKFLGGES